MITARRILGMVTVTAIAVTMLAGCSTQATQGDASPAGIDPQPTLNALPGAVAEYEAATAEYALPDGYVYPKAPFSDASGSYQAGYGATAAVTYWNCAWGRTYLKSQGVDPVAGDAALVQFAAITDTDVYKLYYDPASAYPLFENAIASGKLGDPSGVQILVDGGCPPA
jgi:hypothetical protein